MTLRNRIALIFALLNLALFILIFVSLYVLTRRYTHTEFFDRLEDRANLAVQVLLEKDEIEPQKLADASRRRLRTLIQEQEFVINLDSIAYLDAMSLPDYIDRLLLEEIFHDGSEHFVLKRNILGVGLLYEGKQGTYAVIVTAEDFYGQRKLNNLLKLMSLFLVLSIAIVFLLGSWYSWHILKPIGRMVRSMKSINSSNLNLRLAEEEASQDELGQLAEAFNRLLDRIEAAIETQNLFVGHASHELKNPLTAIMGQVEAALQQAENPHRQALQIIAEESNRLNALLQKLVSLSYADAEGEVSWRFDELLFDVVDEIKATHSMAIIRLDFAHMPPSSEGLFYQGSYQLLRIAISNLIENAVKFSQGTEVRVKVDFQGDRLVLEVSDQGVGIAPEDQPHIFSPFYRAENAKGFPGYGIGLSLAEKITKMHQGKLSVVSQLDQGTVFTLELPF
jgi:signal transduction histidine kinase